MNPLDQLRDIHVPTTVEWWPLAIGWWLAAALFLIALVFLFLCRNKNKEHSNIVHSAIEALNQLEEDAELSSHEWLQALSALLRRIVINLHGRKEVAGLVGHQWLEYLDKHTSSNDFTTGVGQLLATEPYQEESSYDRKVLSDLVRNWLQTQTKQVSRSGDEHA